MLHATHVADEVYRVVVVDGVTLKRLCRDGDVTFSCMVPWFAAAEILLCCAESALFSLSFGAQDFHSLLNDGACAALSGGVCS